MYFNEKQTMPKYFKELTPDSTPKRSWYEPVTFDKNLLTGMIIINAEI